MKLSEINSAFWVATSTASKGLHYANDFLVQNANITQRH